MRLIEAVAVLIALAATGALLFAPAIGAGRAPALALTAAAAVVVGALHVVGPFRWQMIPVEALILALLVMSTFGVEPDGAGRIAAAAAALAPCALTVVLAVGFPVVKLPAPDGHYAVGAATTELSRPAGAPDQPERRLVVKVWYPAEESTGRVEPLWSEIRAPGMPAPLRFFLRYLDAVPTHAYPNAPIRADGGPLPLLIYQHALVAIPSDNTLLMEALASSGFIVVAVSHADHAAEHAALARAIPADESARDKQLYAVWRAASERAERTRLMAEITANSSVMSEIVRRRAADAAFALDRIETVLAAISGADERADGASIADLERVGALGFSIGGAAATRWCLTDRRCRAVVNIDGGLFGVPADAALEVSYLMLYAEETEGVNDQLKARSRAAFEEETFAGAKHMDFTDATVLWPLLKRLGVLGPASGADIVRRKNERIRTFLAVHLKAVG